MNITVINGTEKHGVTYRLKELFLEAFKEKASVFPIISFLIISQRAKQRMYPPFQKYMNDSKTMPKWHCYHSHSNCLSDYSYRVRASNTKLTPIFIGKIGAHATPL